MIICPMCEHQQAEGIECEVCGKKLTAAAPVVVAVAPLPELEQTQLAGGRAPVPVAAIPDLELTAQPPVRGVAVQPVPELDTGRSAAAGNVLVAPMQDMDTGRELSDGQRTAAPTGPGRLPLLPQRAGERGRVRSLRHEAAQAAPGARRGGRLRWAGAAGERTACPRCHTPGYAGRACITCSTLIPSAE